MKKFYLLTKTLLVAALLMVGASNAWAGDMPTPVYFNDFSSAEGLTIQGTGSFTTISDSRFGKVFSNAASASPRTNYLLLPSTVFSAFSDGGGKSAMSISFWVNAKNAGGASAYTYAPLFAAYSAAPVNGENTSPMICLQSRGFMQINNNGWCDFVGAQNVDEKNHVYNNNAWEANDANYIKSGNWLDDNHWHLYTMTLTASQATIYLDGVVKNQWNLDGSDGQYVSGMFTKSATNLTYVCLGGNQAWNFGDNDAAFMFDDFAVYDVALTTDQINQIIDTKTAINAIPSSFDFSTNNAYTDQTVAPFNENTEIKSGGGNIALALSAINSTSTAWVDTDTDTDGRQPYEIANNEKITATFTVLCGWNGSNSAQTVALVNEGGYTLASFKYETNPTTITDVKIGGVTPDGFTASPSINNGNGFDRWGSVVEPQVVTITISGSRYVTLNVVNTTKSVDWTVSGTIDNALIDLNLAKITYSYSNANFNNNRSMAIKSLALSTETVSEANVTYKYVDTSDNDLSSIVADKVAAASIGATIDDELIPASYKTSFVSGDGNTKYVYSTFSSSDATVQAGGSTVYLKFAPKAKFTYTKRAMDGESVLNATLATGDAYEGETVTLSWPKYIEVDGKWYVTSANYQSSSTTGATENVAYTLTNVTQYVEATSSNWASTSDSRAQYSKGVAYRGANTAKTIITAEESGVYSIIYAVCSNSTGTPRMLDVYKNSAEDANKLQDKLSITWSYNYINSTGTKTITNIVLAAGDKILLKPSDTNVILDYVALAKTGEVATFGENGFTTFASPYPLDLTAETQEAKGFTAYRASAIDGTTVTFKDDVNQNVAANTGVLLKGTANATIYIPVVATGTALEGNAFHVNTSDDTFAAEDGYTYYGMIKDSNPLTFGTFDPTTVAIPASKAYLKVNNSTGELGAREIEAIFGDELTGINEAKSEVEFAKEGKFVVDGKLLIFKKGMKFNANGARIK